ncbi:MAG TPA: hypothetical protein VL334_22180, partial [Anaerolineae bacterium]|nr:hypothetical protein [Anaerolineae bacterium]
MQPPTPRSASRLVLIVALLLLLAALAVPALAQEGTTTSPLAAAPASPAAGGACSPLSKDEQATFDKLAQLKESGQLDSAGYDLFLKLGEQTACAATAAAPDGIEAVSGYAFAQSNGTYTAITGGSTLGTVYNDDQLFSNIAIGFSFNYDGTSYTTVGICTNGYIVMGLNSGGSCGSVLPISSTTYNNLISALGWDLRTNSATSELRYQTQGTAPNRTFTVQWKNYLPWNAVDYYNFQITLYETSNVVEMKYGPFTVNSTGSTPQVGIKGASYDDFSNRTTTTNWSASTAGGSNTATMTLSSTVKPASGQTYTWTPPVTSFPYTQNFDGVTAPVLPTGWTVADGATSNNVQWANVFTNAARSTPNAMGIGSSFYYPMDDWFFSPPLQLTGGTPYQVTFYYLPGGTVYTERMEVKWGTAPSAAGMTGGQIWNNPVLNNTSYAQGTSTAFTPDSTGIYYIGWHGYSEHGTSGITVDDITVEPDPTVTSFPYTQNFDGVTAPALPTGWTVADGATSNSIQWATTSYNARSAPNAMYIGWDPVYFMDDWFFSPPLQLTGGAHYQVTFYYRAGNSIWTERMEVQWGTAPSAAFMTGGQIWDDPGFTNTSYAQGTSTTIIPDSTGIYYIGWHGYSAAAQLGILVDDITVSVLPSCATAPSPADAAANVSINTSLAWAAGAGGAPTSYDVYFGASSTPPFVTNVANSPHTPGTLAPNTTF